MQEKRQSLRALDWVNFFLADVQGGIGPYLAIFLLASEHWNPARIGMAIAVGNIAGVVAQAPAGALVDWFKKKTLLVVIGSLLTAVGCVVTVRKPGFSVVMTMQALIGAAASLFAPAIAAISLGMVGYQKLEHQMGRNGAFNHGGNVAAAVLSAIAGRCISNGAIFYLMGILGVLTSVAALGIRERDIDNQLARGHAPEDDGQTESVSLIKLFQDTRLLVFFIAVVLFHFANAAMLPLVGQLLSVQGKAENAAVYMSVCIIIAQLVMIPASTLSGKYSQSWGRKAVFLVGFIILPIRGVLYTFSHNANYLVAVQSLDGIGAGIFGVVSVIVIADLTHGTGRFNLTQGILAMTIGVGAGLSNAMTGLLVKRFGYDAGFLTLAAIAAIALFFFALAMPETKPGMQQLANRRWQPVWKHS